MSDLELGMPERNKTNTADARTLKRFICFLGGLLLALVFIIWIYQPFILPVVISFFFSAGAKSYCRIFF